MGHAVETASFRAHVNIVSLLTYLQFTIAIPILSLVELAAINWIHIFSQRSGDDGVLMVTIWLELCATYSCNCHNHLGKMTVKTNREIPDGIYLASLMVKSRWVHRAYASHWRRQDIADCAAAAVCHRCQTMTSMSWNVVDICRRLPGRLRSQLPPSTRDLSPSVLPTPAEQQIQPNEIITRMALSRTHTCLWHS